jgi:hypothetical protein
MQKHLVLLGRRTREVLLLLLAMPVKLPVALHVSIEGQTVSILVLGYKRKLLWEDLPHSIVHRSRKNHHNLEWRLRKEAIHPLITVIAID